MNNSTHHIKTSFRQDDYIKEILERAATLTKLSQSELIQMRVLDNTFPCCRPHLFRRGDESFTLYCLNSMLGVQAQVINLFQDIQQQTGVALIFIAHDLSIVRPIANRTAVMYLGRVVETGASVEVFNAPEHPYARALVSAIPILNPVERTRRKIISIPGEPPSPLDRQTGCQFRNRCWMASDICSVEEPQLESFGKFRQTACHHAGAYKAIHGAK